MRKPIRLLTVFLLFLIPAQSLAQDFKVAFGVGRPPYSYSDQGTARGIETDIVKAILRRMGVALEEKSMSVCRIEAESKHGNTFDAVVGVPPGKDVHGRYYSKSIAVFENSLITLRSRKFNLKKISDLDGLSVGVWHNARYELGKEFRKVFAPKANGRMPESYREYSRQEEQVKSLWNGEVDAIVVDRLIFEWLRVSLPGQVNAGAEVDVFDLFPVQNHSHVVFKEQRIRDIFDKELRRLYRSGEYEQIVRTYLKDRFAAMFKSGS